MARKNCRMTEEERAIHDRAVSVRKMTDRQICEFIDKQYSTGMDEGIRLGKAQRDASKSKSTAVEKFIAYLEEKVGSGNGIGGGTIYRLKKEQQNAVTDGAIGGSRA